MASVALAGVIGSPLSGFIMTYLDGVSTLTGWQWLFLIEAVPAIILGIIVAFWLENGPEQARWLTSDERKWLSIQLTAESLNKEQSEHIICFSKALCNSKLWLLSFT